MTELFAHQKKGIEWLASKPSAGLFWMMGCGKSRTALFAARKLFDALKIDRVLVCAPSAVLIAWREELAKLSREGFNFNLLEYKPKEKQFRVEAVGGNLNHDRRHMPIALMSYSLLGRGERSKKTDVHAQVAERWTAEKRTALVCDESSFLKSRTAKQTKAAHEIAKLAVTRWLLSGTPVCNSPLDLYSQGKVMAPSGGPLSGISSFYVFEAMFGVRTPVVVMRDGKTVLDRKGNPIPVTVVGKDARGRMKRQVVKQWHPDERKLEQLTKRFAPYVSRVEKKDCLDLPDKSYTVREVQLTDETWKIYQELRREAMLALPDSEARPEPNAGVRLLRLCQLTSGHVGMREEPFACSEEEFRRIDKPTQDVSSEKLDWLAEQIVSGELAGERALIVWCRWRRERERMKALLEKATYESFKKTEEHMLFPIYEIFGGQNAKEREEQIQNFQCSQQHMRTVLLAQQHAGGFGLNLTAASTAVYLSNDWSYSTRVQSEDRTHRIGQKNPCLYVDVVAVGPKGQRTVDHTILEALREKKSLAEWTCAQWRRALEEE